MPFFASFISVMMAGELLDARLERLHLCFVVVVLHAVL